MSKAIVARQGDTLLRMRARLLNDLTLLLMVLSCGQLGCALALTKYVPDDYNPSQELECTSDNTYVMLDVLAGLVRGGR